MSNADRLALLISLLAIAAAALVGGRVFDRMAHLEDEFAYVWQAQAAARGDLTVPSPAFPDSFLVPFVVDYQGQRFGKYPPGWPALLSLGVRVGARGWVNPLLAGLAVWLTYRLGKRVENEAVGLLAAGLTLTSPFFLINTGTLLSHPWSLVLTASFILTWFEGFTDGETQPGALFWVSAVLGGMCLGLLGLTRPMTMIGVAIPFGIHGLTLLVGGHPLQRKRVFVIGAIALFLASFHFLWQYVLTGDFFKNPYTLWWPYDKVGFGPGYGVTKEGHNLQLAWWNTKHSLRTGLSDLFGWGKLSWLFLPCGLWAFRKNARALLLGSVFPSLVLVYGTYWVGSWLLGPRYFFSALPGLTVFTAAGIVTAAGWSLEKGRSLLHTPQGWRRVRPMLVAGLVLVLIFLNLRFYLPLRLTGLHGLYGIQREDLKPFQREAVKAFSPALFIVHADQWMPYGSYLELTTPYFDTPYLFAWDMGPKRDAALAAAYEDQRAVFHYYPDEPWTFYESPRRGEDGY